MNQRIKSEIWKASSRKHQIRTVKKKKKFLNDDSLALQKSWSKKFSIGHMYPRGAFITSMC